MTDFQARLDALPEWPKPMRGMPLESAADTLDAALARLAVAREWIERIGHAYGCHLESVGNGAPCTCGRDALLAKLEGPRNA